MGKKSGSGSRIILETISWVKIIYFFDTDPEYTSRIRNSGIKTQLQNFWGGLTPGYFVEKKRRFSPLNRVSEKIMGVLDLKGGHPVLSGPAWDSHRGPHSSPSRLCSAVSSKTTSPSTPPPLHQGTAILKKEKRSFIFSTQHIHDIIYYRFSYTMVPS